MKMFIAGKWIDARQSIDVTNPFDGSTIDTVPRAEQAHVESAIEAAVEGAAIMRRMPGYERFKILRRTAQLMEERASDLGRLISQEEGKTLHEGRTEVARGTETMELSAEEAKRLGGEVLPLDGAPGAAPRFGFTIRVPCGVVVAITPFNFPMNLVCHKIGPALAAGNSVILKPATDTPLTALRIVELLLEAGLPPLAISCLTGAGGEIGDALVSDPRVRKVTFTGSAAVGEHICKIAGLKRVTMELGSNSPLVVMPDADLQKVAEAAIVTGYGNAGQICIATQRVIATRETYADVLDVLKPRVAGLRAGNQLDEQTQMGPMIREADAKRVHDWVHEAVGQGARLVTGGSRDGNLMQPTLLAEVDPRMRVSCEELFGPAVGVTKVDSIEHAIALAGDTKYGLSAGIFTKNIEWAMKFAREVDAGNLHINWGPAWRADLMPYGGLKHSGMGREGPKYAIEAMTEMKTVVMHLS